ncbi:MAG: aminomethyl-transferring glycine dehydrogenase subunit GcvPB [Magnetococcales bacterium]|nr:aminomethyl-transferring glycine dehydrogenase subunit GcvPB [Magnetococcales bacterium]
MSVIFESSRKGRRSMVHAPMGITLKEAGGRAILSDLPENALRTAPLPLPEVSELEAVRHYTRLSQINYSIDTNFYPLGSCTMKYNPKVCNTLALHPGFLGRHPLSPVDADLGQGVLSCLYDLQRMLKGLIGLPGVSLTPMAGAQGEFAGVAMIRAFHDARDDRNRTEILVPDASHGTNPATATMCGYTVKEIPTLSDGDVDLEALKAAVGPQTAGLMLTNPSTLGVFERSIREMAKVVHDAGGLLYYDGANLNAIAQRVRPGDMGFDCVHLNVHKTFATPHGGGGPGAGPVLVNQRLMPHLPIPTIRRGTDDEGRDIFRLTDASEYPQSMGPLSAFAGNVGVLLRAYVYLRLTGSNGMRRVSEFAVLNANYLMKRLTEAGFTAAFPERRATHEFILTLKNEADSFGVTALDFAKRLLDYGFYAPTIYFPLLVPECLLIEPTETESKEELDRFVAAMIAIRKEAETEPETVRTAPHTTPVGRLDETRAARQPDLVWSADTTRT